MNNKQQAIYDFLVGLYGKVVVDTVGIPFNTEVHQIGENVVIENISDLHETMLAMAVEKEKRRLRFEEMDRVIADQHNWVFCKRKGNRIRFRHSKTGAVDPEWYPLFVTVPSNVNILNMNSDQFSKFSRENRFPPR